MTTRRTLSSTTLRLAAVPALGLLLLGACSPTVPDSGAGVGFQDYNSYIRDAQNQQQAAAGFGASDPYGPSGQSTAQAPQGFDLNQAAAAIDRAEGIFAPAQQGTVATATAPAASQSFSAPMSALSVAPGPAPTPPAAGAMTAIPQDSFVVADQSSGTRPRGNAPATIKEQSGEMTHIAAPKISDENDFAAVSNRETIASDAERIAQNRAQYVVVQPKELPQRPGDTGPNIVEYALATNNVPGQVMFKRGSSRRDPLVICAQYSSPDQAQQEFLATGGPQRDRKGLDPDGDGFACDWDPRPFRSALQ